MKRALRLAAILLILLSLTGSISWVLLTDTAPPAPVEIAVIAYGGESQDRWRAMEQGIRQACSELGLQVPVVTLAPADDPGQQLMLLRRAVENGARGLLLAAGDSELLRDALQEQSLSVPLVMLESGAGEGAPALFADHAAMGAAMADLVAGEPEEITIAVLEEGLAREGVALRYEAFLARMEELGREVTVLKREDPWDNLTNWVALSLATHRPAIDILVSLDNDSLEAALDAVPIAMVEARLFGIGSSDRVVDALDRGEAERIIYHNEYAVGYLATMELASRMGLTRRGGTQPVSFVPVGLDNLYEPEIERLLFPITQ